MFTKVDTKIGLVKHQFGLNSITKLLGKVAEMGLSENSASLNPVVNYCFPAFLQHGISTAYPVDTPKYESSVC